MTIKVLSLFETWVDQAFSKSEANSAMRRFHTEYFGCIEDGTALDLEGAYKQARSQFLHMLWMVVVAVLTPIAVLAGIGLLGIEMSSNAAKTAWMLLAIFSVYWAIVFGGRAGDLYLMNKAHFEKGPFDSFNSIMTKWADKDPAVHRFVTTNIKDGNVSKFEFELVQSYIHRRKFGLV